MAKAKAREKDQAPLNILGRLKILRQMKDGLVRKSMPMFMVLAWIYSVSMMVKSIVYEKEKRLKEVMKAMGLGNGVHWLAWFITCFTMMFISTILLLIILSVSRIVTYGAL